MRKFNFLIIGILLCFAFSVNAEKFPVRHQHTFKEIYKSYPAIPVGLVEAIAYNNTRMRHITVSQDSMSCTGMPRYHTLMGLVDDGKHYFRSSLSLVSELSGISKEEILNNPQKSVMAYASAMNQMIMRKNVPKNLSPIELIPEIIALSELPLTDDIQNDFALNSDLYIIFTVLQNEEFRSIYNIPYYNYNLREVFGANYDILSATRVSALDGSIVSDEANPYRNTNRRAACAMPNGPIEYPLAIWNPADPSNYSSASVINTRELIAIHTIQGKYTGAISWFKNPSANVSTPYVVRSYDGQVTQMACHITKCWHVASQNPYSVGIEHEGYIDDGMTWYTTEMYAASADLVKFIANQEGVNLLQTYDGPPTNGILTLSNSCHKVKGHQHHDGNSHVDPGPQFEWKRFYRLLNDLPTPTSSTVASGTMYDSGGAGGNYSNEERTTYLINPTGNDPVQLTFTSYSVEDGWDYLWIYDGTDDTGNLIGEYSGTSPGTVTAYSGAVFMEFRSDCATTAAGWAVNWTTTTVPACQPPTGLSASFITPMVVDINWNAVAGANSYTVQYKPTLDPTWNEITTSVTSLELTGLRSSAEYEWRVKATCSPDPSAYAASKFTTPGAAQMLTATAGSYYVTNCSGEFYDTGGKESEYGNYQDWTYTIAPVGATSVTVTFTAFNIENGYDFLKIYDGETTSSSLIGSYTGTNSPGTIVSSGDAITFHFKSDNWTIASGWEATWSCNGGASSTDPTTSIVALNDWYTTDFNVLFTDADSSGTGIQEEFYQVLAFDGTEFRGNAQSGFFFDGFDNTLHPEWTTSVGTWAESGGVVTQSDETSSNTNMYANLTQGNEIYLYHWQMKIGGSGTNRRAGLHFYCDDPTKTQRGNSYMIYFRADNNKTQIYKSDPADNIPLYTDDATTINADQWYDYKVIYNSFTGEIKAFQNDVLVSSWTDPSPLTSANSISLRTGNCNVEYDDFHVYKYRTSIETITVGNIGNEVVQYQNPSPSQPACEINSIIIDNTDTWSLNAYAYANIDWTNPSSVVVYDGVSLDIDTTYNNTQLTANWTTAADVNSGITKYWYKIGTTPGASDVVELTDNGNNTLVTVSGLNLTYEQIYYVTVIAENGAGLLSAESTSDGVRVVEVCQKLPSTYASTTQQWYSDDFTVYFTNNDSCSNGLAYQFYQVLDFDGAEWRGNNAQGFFNDDFSNSIHVDWTQNTGTWSIDFLRLKQSDESLSNTNIYASVDQIGSEVYMYEWDAIMDGAGGNRRGGLHFFCDDPTLTNRGNSYFVWFRVDNNKMQIYKVTNDAFSLVEDVVVDVNPGQMYNNKVIYNPSIGEILVYRDNEFIGSWTDSSPITSGNSISLRSGNALMYYDKVRVYKGRTTAETVSLGALATDFVKSENPHPDTASCVINSLIVDNESLISPLDEYYVNIDWSVPSTVSVIDGIGTDKDVTFSSTQLTASWTPSTDNNSGITNYWYAIGDTPGGTNIVNWTSSALDTAITHTGLSLTLNTTYYISVYATNGAGLDGLIGTSDGQMVLEANAPIASGDVTYCDGDAIANVSATDNNGGTLTWYSDANLSNVLGTGLSYTPINTIGTTTYYVTETVSGNESESDSVKVTINALPNADAGTNTSICLNSSTTITASGGNTYSWDKGLGTGASHSVTPTVNTTYNVTVTDANNCSAVDQVTISVTALPTVDAGANLTICERTSVQLSATGASSYIWDNGLGTGQNQAVSPSAQTVYSVTGTDANGCVASDNVTVSLLNLPSIVTTGVSVTDTDCGLSTGAISGITASGSGTLNYNWQNANYIQVGTSADLSGLGAGGYKLHVSDDNCTDSTIVFVVGEIGAPSVPTVTGAATYCIGETINGLSATGSGGTLTWYSDAGLTNILTTGSSYNPINITVTTSYYVAETQGGCESNATTATITVNPLPNVDAGNSRSICDGTSTTLVASGGSTYLWDNGLGSGAAHNVSPGVQTTYSVTATSNGCSATDQVTISVTANPIADAGANKTICNGESVTLTVDGGTSYNWDNGLGTGQSHVVLPSSTTTYTVTVTENGCTDTDVVSVSVTAIPTANAGNNKTICKGTSTTINATGGTSYVWNNGLGVGQSHTVSPTVNTVYTVTVTNNGCSASDDIIVSVLNGPTANAGNDATLCYGESTTLIASGGVSYVWSNSLGSGNNKVVTPTVSTTYTVTVTDVNGCKNSDDVVISVNSLPNANAGNDKTICAGQLVNLTASGGGTYTWSNGLGSGATKSVTPNTTTNYSVTVTNNGCSVSDDVTISVTNAVAINAGNDQTICLGQSATLQVTGGATYEWNEGLGSGSTHIVSPNSTTTYIVSTTDGICNSSDDITVFVNPIPNANAGSDEVICSGESILLMATGGTSYMWSDGIGAGSTQNVSPTTDITYTVTVTENGCSSTDEVSITVNPTPISQFMSLETINYDPDFDVSFTNQSQNATNYMWYFGDGNTSMDENPTHTYTSTGTYTITLTASNGLCADDIEIKTNYIEILPMIAPVASFTVNDLSTCSNQSLDITNDSQHGQSYLWEIDGQGYSATSTGLNPDFVVTASGSYNLSLTTTNAQGSDIGTQSVNISVIQSASATFSVSDTTVAPGEIVTFTNTSTGGNNYCWDFDDGSITCGNNPSVFHLYGTEGDYEMSLIVIDPVCGNDTTWQTIHVVDPASFLPLAQFSISNNTLCEGEIVTVTNNSTNSDSYIWSVSGGNINSVTATEPTITITNSSNLTVELSAFNTNGSDVEQQVFSVVPLPDIDFTASDTVVLVNVAVVGFNNNSQFANSYSWNFGDGNTSTNVAPWNNYQNVGDYTVKLEATNNCGTVSLTKSNYISVIEPNAIEEITWGSVEVYPNPISKSAILDLEIVFTDKYQLILNNTLGQNIILFPEKQLLPGKYQIPIDIENLGLSEGLYFVQLKNSELTLTYKLIVQ